MKIELLKQHRSFAGTTRFYSHESKLTGTSMKFSVFLPDLTGKAEQCLVWLSGLTCNEENFITKAGAQKLLSNSKMMVICPDTSPRGLDLPSEHESWDFGSGAGFYVDATTEGYSSHYKMESYITEELVAIAREHFGVKQFAISGHSMGGHGALTLGLNNPKLFESVSAFSPIVNPSECPWGQKAFNGYLGSDQKTWQRYDATVLIKNGAKHAHKILIDQGSGDDFLARELLTENIVKAAAESEQELEVRMQEGHDHSYYFIATFLEDHVKFHAKNLA